MESEKKKTAEYRLYIFTFLVLTALTLLAVGFTQVRFNSPVLITLVLLIAVFQAVIVLFYNMHLKFHDRFLLVFVIVIFTLMFMTIITTLVDYLFR